MGSTLWYKLATSFRGLFPENEVGQYTFCLPLPVITAPPSSSVLSVFGSEVLSFSCAWPPMPTHSNSVRDIKSRETKLTLTMTCHCICFAFLGKSFFSYITFTVTGTKVLAKCASVGKESELITPF